MMDNDNHPEQEPAEGSRETVEKDLKRQEQLRSPVDKKTRNEDVAGSEAAEPSPE